MTICLNCVETYQTTDLIEYDCPVCKTHRTWNRIEIEKVRLTAVRAIRKSAVRSMSSRAMKAHMGLLSFLDSKGG